MQEYMNIDANGFAAQTRFLMSDDFHRQMFEGQQTGLSYYICFAAEAYADKQNYITLGIWMELPLWLQNLLQRK